MVAAAVAVGRRLRLEKMDGDWRLKMDGAIGIWRRRREVAFVLKRSRVCFVLKREKYAVILLPLGTSNNITVLLMSIKFVSSL